MDSSKFDKIINSNKSLLDFDFKELIRYRELVLMFVKRDFATMYKQTILGPLWFLIVPLITSAMQLLVFGKFAGISCDGIPQFLFYMAGNTIWLYISRNVTNNSTVFVSNAKIFSKVYFPRLIMPLAISISGLITFAIQFSLFAVGVVYYTYLGQITPNCYAFTLPLLMIILMMLSFGVGILISALTTKYRDLTILLNFAIQLWMYASAVIYPVSSLDSFWANLNMYNPVVPVVEAFRYAFTGHGIFSCYYLSISFLSSLIILCVGCIIFNKVQKDFIDVI